MSDYLLAAILAVLVAQNMPRLWAWVAPRYRHWRKRREWAKRGR